MFLAHQPLGDFPKAWECLRIEHSTRKETGTECYQLTTAHNVQGRVQMHPLFSHQVTLGSTHVEIQPHDASSPFLCSCPSGGDMKERGGFLDLFKTKKRSELEPAKKSGDSLGASGLILGKLLRGADRHWVTLTSLQAREEPPSLPILLGRPVSMTQPA